MNQEMNSNPPTGVGFLVVQVTTANGSIPLANAAVTIRSTEAGEARNVLYELRSGSDGRTERVALAAPLREASLTPDGGPAFASYYVEAVLPGYITASYESVPIFDGITAIQQANLVPLPENGYPDGLTLNNARHYGGAATAP